MSNNFIYIHTKDGRSYRTRLILPVPLTGSIIFTDNDSEEPTGLPINTIKEISLVPEVVDDNFVQH